MPMPTEEGRYRCRVLGAGVAETGPNNLTTVTLKLGLTEKWEEGQWVDVEGYKEEITSYSYLEKKDGSVNQFQVDMLRAALGWPNDDPFWFEDNNLPELQVTLRVEMYNGQERMKVAFLNPYDYEGSGNGEVPHSDDDMRRRIRARLGSQLRATAPSPARPAVPPRSAAPPPRPATPPVPADDEATVWAEFKQECSERGVPEDVVRTLWNDALTAVAGEALDALDGAQCQDLRIALGEALSKL